MSKKNKGESGEILFKIKLVQMRDNGESFNGIPIESVGYVREYGHLTRGLEGVVVCSNDELMKISGEMMIDKAGVFDKADVYINKIGVSLKATYGANSALINHTNRFGFERVCHEVGADITILDEIIDKYWELRLIGELSEDVPNWNPNSPFREHKEYFRPILEYFLFTGSGSKDSKHPAEYIIEFADSMDPGKWKVITKEEAIDKIWDKLVFSMRSNKGMPKNYNPDTYKGKGSNCIKRWVKLCDGEYKGALHVRIKAN
mgnify:CR=1 FL=1